MAHLANLQQTWEIPCASPPHDYLIDINLKDNFLNSLKVGFPFLTEVCRMAQYSEMNVTANHPRSLECSGSGRMCSCWRGHSVQQQLAALPDLPVDSGDIARYAGSLVRVVTHLGSALSRVGT